MTNGRPVYDCIERIESICDVDRQRSYYEDNVLPPDIQVPTSAAKHAAIWLIEMFDLHLIPIHLGIYPTRATGGIQLELSTWNIGDVERIEIGPDGRYHVYYCEDDEGTSK